MAKFKKNKKLQGTPVGKAKNNQKNKVVSKIKKKAIANGRNNVGDARNVLHAKSRRQMLTGGKKIWILTYILRNSLDFYLNLNLLI